MTQKEFIEQIAQYCKKYYKQFGYQVVSPAIAQACLESAYGTSYKAQFHNYFGLKYRQNRVTCNNGFFYDGGSEQSQDGNYNSLPETTAWYKFDTMELGVKGYYEFLKISNYDAVRAAKTPLEYLQAIKNAGYATSLNYVQNVYNVIQKLNLTQYDVITSPKSTESTISIINCSSTHNTTTKPNRNIDYIVLHYTAGTNSSSGAARNTAGYFQRTTVQASADFIVDDVEIVQYNPDPKNRYCWAVGGNLYSNKINSLAGTMYGKCMNNNSIHIEMCSRKRNTASLAVTDDDWFLTDATINNAVKLTKYLMKLYNIDINHVIMHNHVTGKWCPQPWCKNERALSEWKKFLNKLGNAGTSSSSNIIKDKTQNVVIAADENHKANFKIKVTASILNIRSGPGTMYSKTGVVRKDEEYDIIAVMDDWGYLSNKRGWISLEHVEKIGIQSQEIINTLYLVRVTADTLNVREGPSTTYKIVTSVHRPSVYTIVAEQNGWGLLKSYQTNKNGWICLKYTEKY